MKERLKMPLRYIGKAAAVLGLLAMPLFLTTCTPLAYPTRPQEKQAVHAETIAPADKTRTAMLEMDAERMKEYMETEHLRLPDRLLELETAMPYAVLIEKSTQRLYLYERTTGWLEWQLKNSYIVSTGTGRGDKKRAGDHATPEGTFLISENCNSKDWVSIKDNSIGAYGKYFLRISCGSWDKNGNYYPDARSSIGIHGTNHPSVLGKPTSWGCIQLENKVLNELVENGYLCVNTPVIIAERV